MPEARLVRDTKAWLQGTSITSIVIDFVTQTVTLQIALVLHERCAASVCCVVDSPP
jgi:hypothetical protein